MNLRVLSQDQWLLALKKDSHPVRKSYRAMYSTWWDGIVTDPNLMVIPIDDHQVHRGDAVFEALRFINGRVYLAKEHLDRMDRSAAAIGLKCPFSREQMLQLMHETIKASGLKEAMLRLFLGRGPGSFSTNPYDSLGAQVHLVVTEFKPFDAKKSEQGVALGASKIPAKESWLAQIKSCNYLVNVLMKKEAVDRGLDFTIGVDPQGFLTEGSTENLILITKEGALIRPMAESILAGTTMMRLFQLIEAQSGHMGFTFLGEKTFSVKDLLQAQEVIMIGTTLDVLPVISFDGTPIGSGKPGSFTQKFRQMIVSDQNI